MLSGYIKVCDPIDSIFRKEFINLINHGKITLSVSLLGGKYDGIMEREYDMVIRSTFPSASGNPGSSKVTASSQRT
jgi:hypothetical protein